MARWTVVQDAAQARAAGPGSKIEAFVKVNAASESDVVSAASRLSGKKGEDVVPTLQGSSLAGPPLWPTGHRASLFVAQSAVAQGGALVLELHNSQGMIGRAVIPTSDFGANGRPTELNHVPLVSAGGGGSGAGAARRLGRFR